MISDPLLHQLSVRAKSFIGAIIFQRFCSKYALPDEFIDSSIKHWCDLAASESLGDWDAKGSMASASNQELRDFVKAKNVDEDFIPLYNEGQNIGICDLYTVPSGESIESLIKMIEIAKKHNIQLPDFTLFLEHTKTTEGNQYWDGWREPVNAELLNRWEMQLQGVSNG